MIMRFCLFAYLLMKKTLWARYVFPCICSHVQALNHVTSTEPNSEEWFSMNLRPAVLVLSCNIPLPPGYSATRSVAPGSQIRVTPRLSIFSLSTFDGNVVYFMFLIIYAELRNFSVMVFYRIRSKSTFIVHYLHIT